MSGWEDCDAALSAAAGAAIELRRTPARGDCPVPDGVRGPHRSGQNRARRAGPSRDRVAQGPAARRRRAAAHDRPASSGRGRGARRLRGRCQRSTRRIRFDRASSRSGRSWCSARTIFHTPSPASRVGISLRQSLQAILSSARRTRCIRAPAGCSPKPRSPRCRTPGCRRRPCRCIYKIDHQSGQRLVSDPRVGASAFTGSREPAWR